MACCDMLQGRLQGFVNANNIGVDDRLEKRVAERG